MRAALTGERERVHVRSVTLAAATPIVDGIAAATFKTWLFVSKPIISATALPKRERNHYAVRLPHLKKPHIISKLWFHLYLSAGLIERDIREPKLARIKAGFTAWIDTDGRLQFVNTQRTTGPSIPSSWDWVEEALKLGLIGPNLSNEQLAANLRAEYCITA
jgi:hypothetical protein